MHRLNHRLKLGGLLAAIVGSIALACIMAGSIATRKLLGRDSPLLAFDATPGSKGEIFLVNTGGLLYTSSSITHSSADDCCPAWSPDGKRVAFESDRNGSRDIFIMNADGTGQRPLTDSAADDYEPVWQP